MVDNNPLEILVVGYGRSDVTFVDRLIAGLLEKGVRVTVATSRKQDLQRISSWNPIWLRIPRYSSKLWVRIIVLLWLLITNPQLRRPAWFSKLIEPADDWQARIDVYLRYLPFTRKSWDVIYFPWNSAAIDYVGLFDSGIPVVVSCRGSQVNIRPHRKGQEDYVAGLQETLSRANAIHCVSYDILNEIKQYCAEKSRTKVIYSAVDTDFFALSSAVVHKKTLNLITIGSLVWVKGYEYILMSLALLRDMGIDANLHIVGEGYELNRILFTVNDLDLGERVILHGKLSPEQVKQQLQQSDIFVFASLSEGLPNVVLEAMSCGLPVVTSDCGGVRESVTDGVEGFVVPTRAPRQMAEAIQKLALDPELRQTMGSAGRKRVLRDFRLEDQVDAFIALFNSVRPTEAGVGDNDLG